jgi:hypothetical protein
MKLDLDIILSSLALVLVIGLIVYSLWNNSGNENYIGIQPSDETGDCAVPTYGQINNGDHCLLCTDDPAGDLACAHCSGNHCLGSASSTHSIYNRLIPGTYYR